MTIHVIPVPRGMSVDEAFDEIQTMGRFVEYRWWRFRFHWPFRQWAAVQESA